jgi:fructose-1,6-bisphosphatase I
MRHGVHGFTLNPNSGEFILTHPNIQIPPKGKVRIPTGYKE